MREPDDVASKEPEIESLPKEIPASVEPVVEVEKKVPESEAKPEESVSVE